MARKAASLAGWVRTSLAEAPPRSRSLIITLFGDSLLPYVSGIWLSELIALLEPFHINAQLTRTSSFRLAEEGWLASQRDGRRSRYALTESGRQRVEHASLRIYEAPAKAWDGKWTVVMLNKSRSTVAARARLRQELAWEGFGLLAPGLLIHPRADKQGLAETLQRIELLDEVVVLEARDLDGIASRSVTALAEECWDCGGVAGQYAEFLERFAPLVPLVETNENCELAFVAQTLLIHEFRRVVLHDPRLPGPLLPASWPGYAAYDLCRTIYRMTRRQARQHLSTHLHEAAEHALKAGPAFRGRFGGLGR